MAFKTPITKKDTSKPIPNKNPPKPPTKLSSNKQPDRSPSNLTSKSKQSPLQPHQVNQSNSNHSPSPNSPNPTQTSSPNVCNQLQSSPTTPAQSSSTPISYARAANREQTLDKSNAIVFSCIDGTKQLEYVEKIAETVNPSDIKAAFRLSNQRFCVFFANKNIVDNLIDNNFVLKIGDKDISIRRLINPAKRFIISNVCPSIPTSVIEDELVKLNINLSSPITTLRAGFSNPLLSHIISNKKQVYVSPDSAQSVPESLLITHDETTYRIFLVEEGLSCFNCKERGHIAANCTREIEPTQNEEAMITDTNSSQSDTTATSPPTSEQHSAQSNSMPTTTESVQIPMETNQIIHKRFLPSSSSSSSIELVPLKASEKLPTKVVKKTKSVDTGALSLQQIIEPVKTLYKTQPELYEISFEQFEEIMTILYEESNYIDAIKQTDFDPEILVRSLQLLKPHVVGKGAKNRITRVTKALSTKPESSDDETDPESV